MTVMYTVQRKNTCCFAIHCRILTPFSFASPARRRVIREMIRTFYCFWSSPSARKESSKSTHGSQTRILKSIWIAAQKSSARNIIHPIITKKNVINDRNTRCTPLFTSTFRTSAIFSLIPKVSSPTIWYSPCSSPQNRNLIPFPCQKPLTAKVSRIFKYFLALPPRFPPRGIYT